MRQWPLVALALVACKQVDRFGWLDGTRLKGQGQAVMGAPETVSFTNWYDSKLEMKCLFRPSGGKLVCAPTHSVVEYADADCTQPLASQTPCDDKPSYIAEDVTTEPPATPKCDGHPFDGTGNRALRVFKVGDAEFEGATYAKSSAGCLPMQSMPVGTKRFAVAGEVNASQLVSATAENDDGFDGKLNLYALQATDGSEQEVAWADAQGRTVYFARLTSNEDEAFALPTVSAYATGQAFSDAQCQSPAAEYFGPAGVESCVPTAVVVSTPPSTACGDTTQTVHDVGAALSTVYAKSGPTCSERTVSSGAKFFTVGAEQKLETLIKARRVLRGASRGRRYVWLDDKGHTVDRAQVYDNTYQRPCFVAEFIDGKKRCLPEGGAEARFFADAACTAPLAMGSQNDCGTYTPSIWFKYSGDPAAVPPGTCAASAYRIAEVRDIGGSYAGPTYVLDGTTCIEATPPPNTLLFATTAPLAFSNLLEIHQE